MTREEKLELGEARMAVWTRKYPLKARDTREVLKVLSAAFELSEEEKLQLVLANQLRTDA